MTLFNSTRERQAAVRAMLVDMLGQIPVDAEKLQAAILAFDNLLSEARREGYNDAVGKYIRSEI